MKLLNLENWRNARKTFTADRAQLGWFGAGLLVIAQSLTILMKDFGFRHRSWRGSIQCAGLVHKLRFRLFSSDVYTIRQILVVREHQPVSSLHGIRLIVDCGANIGVAAAWLLSRYPDADLIAIEPDEDNFALLCENLRPYGSRARAIRAAIWPTAGEALRCVRGRFADGLDWSATVTPAEEAGGDNIPGVTLVQLLDESGSPAIDLLKMDIEGAEKSVFGSHSREWLSRTRHLCVELHGEECEQAFKSAILDYDYDCQNSNELTVCTNIRHTPVVRDEENVGDVGVGLPQ